MTCQSACNAQGVRVLDQETCPPSGCPYRLPCIGEARQSNKHGAVTLRHGESMCVRVCLHVCSLFLKNNSKTAYKDHDFFLNFLFFLLRNQKIYKIF